jgi:DNA-binding MarR family transcriptional regulator
MTDSVSGASSMARKSAVEAASDVPANPLDNLVGYQLRRASQAMLDDLVDSIADLDLRPPSASVILLVAANPGITQSRIGQTLGIERANMAPMTAKLTRRGLLSRAKTDGRSHGLRLSEEGRRVTGKLRRRIAEHEDRFLRHISAPQRGALLTLLKSLWQ